MNVDLEILKLFNVIEIRDTHDAAKPLDVVDTSMIRHGVITDFGISAYHRTLLEQFAPRLDVNTFFSKQERMKSDPWDLIIKQVLHYIEIYGFDQPGVFSQLHNDGKLAAPIRIVRGVSLGELRDMIANIAYANAPIKDVETFAAIVKAKRVDLINDLIKNNELRVLLFDPISDTFESGDDAVRWIVFKTTGSTMLIKSPEVINEVRRHCNLIDRHFIRRHEVQLAQVFNRHKRVIMALKDLVVRSDINRISRLSKKLHVPIRESIAKTFIAQALNGDAGIDALAKVSIRDKMKYLNLLSWKRQQNTMDAFIIRNGKTHINTQRKVYNLSDIARVEAMVLESLRGDLAHLKDKTIVLDPAVDFGLPTSRKQTLGNLPFGTMVTVNAEKISAGIHWRNEWGARDLDLSTVDEKGNRTGWGHYRGYGAGDIVFSGDVTHAPDGAMEFMTSSITNYGLFVNIYAGEVPTTMELVVGSEGSEQWIEDTVIRERHVLQSRGEVIGFVRGKSFIVYRGRLNERSTTFGENPIIAKGSVNMWTVSNLLDRLEIEYTTQMPEQGADIDLRYATFSFDKLEALLTADG